MRKPSTWGIGVGVVLTLFLMVAGVAYAQQVPLPGASIQKWVDPLPQFPARADATKPLRITAMEIQQQVLPAFLYPPAYALGTYVWGYQIEEMARTGDERAALYPAHYPAFTVVAQRGVPTRVEYINDLVNPFLQQYPAGGVATFAVDQTLNWADPLNQGVQFTSYTGPIPICTHLHGGAIPSAYDGGPDAWFTPNSPGNTPITGPGYVTNVYNYPNDQEAATVWFHDHGLGVTRLTPHMGLAAFYLIKDPVNEPMNLPSGAFDQEIAIQDRMFDTNGQLLFPAAGINPTVHPFWMPEFFGDTIVVNGKTWPYFAVEPRRYRLRLLNGSNARVYNLSLDNPKVPVYLIATDDGYLDAPVKITSLLLAPGERAEIVVDFKRVPKGRTMMINDAKAPYPAGAPADRQTVYQILLFQVNKPLSSPDLSCDPAAGACSLRPNNPIVRLNPSPANVPTRRLTLNEELGPLGPLEMTLNNSKLEKLGMPNAVSERPRVGATEIWEIVNLTADTHPIHTHLFAFQVLNRQKFSPSKFVKAYDASFPGGFNPGDGLTYAPGVFMPGYGPPLPYGNCFAGTVCGGNPDPAPYFQGGVIPAAATENGWKDTVQCNPGEVTRIAIRVAPENAPLNAVSPGVNLYSFDPTAGLGVLDDGFGYPGGPGYVWHCHIIDHEDNEMMRRWEVAP